MDAKQLIDLAGKAAFDRGMHYYLDGAVVALTEHYGLLKAKVEGSYLYEVKVPLDSPADSECTCPAWEDSGFCKHCVAVILQFQAEQREEDEAAEPEPSPRATSKSKQSQRLRDEAQVLAFLHSKGKEELAQTLLSMLRNDPNEFQRWLLKSQAASGAVDSKALRKTITQALPYRSLYSYNEVARYFAHAEQLLQPVWDMIPLLPAEQALKLVEYGYERLHRALERVDDSGGYRFGLEESMESLWLPLFKRLPWSDDVKVDYLIKQLGSADDYPDIPAAFIEDEDTGLLALFYHQLDLHWQGLSTQQKQSSESWRIYQLLFERSEQQQDWPRCILLQQEHAESGSDWLNLCEFCIDKQFLAEARQCWQQASDLIPVPQNRKSRAHTYDVIQAEQRRLPLRELEVRLLTAEGALPEAADKLWGLFQERPAMAMYVQLQTLSQQVGLTEQECLQKVSDGLIQLAKQQQWDYQTTAIHTLLAEIYLHHGLHAQALQLAQAHKLAQGVQQQLATVVFPVQPEAGLMLYTKLILESAGRGADSSVYREVVALLEQLQQMIRAHPGKISLSRFTELVELLRSEYKRRSTFISMLKVFA
ncbi:SWIM zinc finger family protein [Pokkaliibacter plantistimulans]|uniref:SWIM zinc finger family protein n=1 Tax=Pokkaliibacter plantistimulans TaxID=1635171 RepID=UPI0014033243|nr:SWIM zinc finger family protein [Pokkaliibacter plantistimulans]